jgi:hypothetical protein
MDYFEYVQTEKKVINMEMNAYGASKEFVEIFQFKTNLKRNIKTEFKLLLSFAKDYEEHINSFEDLFDEDIFSRLLFFRVPLKEGLNENFLVLSNSLEAYVKVCTSVCFYWKFGSKNIPRKIVYKKENMLSSYDLSEDLTPNNVMFCTGLFKLSQSRKTIKEIILPKKGKVQDGLEVNDRLPLLKSKSYNNHTNANLFILPEVSDVDFDFELEANFKTIQSRNQMTFLNQTKHQIANLESDEDYQSDGSLDSLLKDLQDLKDSDKRSEDILNLESQTKHLVTPSSSSIIKDLESATPFIKPITLMEIINSSNLLKNHSEKFEELELEYLVSKSPEEIRIMMINLLRLDKSSSETVAKILVKKFKESNLIE